MDIEKKINKLSKVMKKHNVSDNNIKSILDEYRKELIYSQNISQ
jgi:hypothetical protein